ncbi:flavin prenyltransferase UbiX [uncultured Ferrimonas sp.]|uniref:flavin prenyltransferase UbiX n=1 Tax=uncultured Ferrimonas sp. TaxID=432640 RepID=UPI002612DE31|nr:flavin prenyltransferase UbiX [uncultured Ferrimonas sp.]
MQKREQAITLAFTGASGAPYGLRLLSCLLESGRTVHLMISSAARVVLAEEEGMKLPGSPEACERLLSERMQAKPGQLRVYGKEQWFSPVASGSGAPRQMVICPCSTGTLAAVATGMSNTLIERAADVVLKERGQLLLVPRETPFNSIHLEHMLKLSNLGAVIMPAAPGFYHQPQSIADLVDFMVARILDHLQIEHHLSARWGYGNQTEPKNAEG